MRTLVPLRLGEVSGRSRLSRIDVLVIDDWVMAPLSEPERRDFWEICEDRYQVRSTILTQLPVTRWHEQVGDPTLADGILDRLMHNAYRIEKRGDSMRKSRGTPNPTIWISSWKPISVLMGDCRKLKLFSLPRSVCALTHYAPVWAA